MIWLGRQTKCLFAPFYFISSLFKFTVLTLSLDVSIRVNLQVFFCFHNQIQIMSYETTNTRQIMSSKRLKDFYNLITLPFLNHATLHEVTSAQKIDLN